jgi:hypothetical protein
MTCPEVLSRHVSEVTSKLEAMRGCKVRPMRALTNFLALPGTLLNLTLTMVWPDQQSKTKCMTTTPSKVQPRSQRSGSTGNRETAIISTDLPTPNLQTKLCSVCEPGWGAPRKGASAPEDFDHIRSEDVITSSDLEV